MAMRDNAFSELLPTYAHRFIRHPTISGGLCVLWDCFSERLRLADRKLDVKLTGLRLLCWSNQNVVAYDNAGGRETTTTLSDC